MNYVTIICSIVLLALVAVWPQLDKLYLPVFAVPLPSMSAILVTGCSSGIGRHLAIDLANEGYMVFATVRKAEDQALFSSVPLVHPIIMEVTSHESIAEAFRNIDFQLSAKNRSLVGVVNNAGVAHIAPVEFIDISMMRHVYEVNVVGVVAITQTFLPLLRKTPGSRIINIGSVAGFFAPLFYGAYSASKFALEAVTDVMRAELRAQEVAVSIIQAGVIADTKIREKNSGKNSVFEVLSPEQRNRYGLPSVNLNDSTERKVAAIEATGEPPRVVTTAVLHALQDRQPRARYFAGKARVIPSWLLKFLSIILPDSLLDKYIRVPPKI